MSSNNNPEAKKELDATKQGAPSEGYQFAPGPVVIDDSGATIEIEDGRALIQKSSTRPYTRAEITRAEDEYRFAHRNEQQTRDSWKERLDRYTSGGLNTEIDAFRDAAQRQNGTHAGHLPLRHNAAEHPNHEFRYSPPSHLQPYAFAPDTRFGPNGEPFTITRVIMPGPSPRQNSAAAVGHMGPVPSFAEIPKVDLERLRAVYAPYIDRLKTLPEARETDYRIPASPADIEPFTHEHARPLPASADKPAGKDSKIPSPGV